MAYQREVVAKRDVLVSEKSLKTPVSRFTSLQKGYEARLTALQQISSRLNSIRSTLLGTGVPAGNGEKEPTIGSVFGEFERIGEKMDDALSNIGLSLDELQDAIQS